MDVLFQKKDELVRKIKSLDDKINFYDTLINTYKKANNIQTNDAFYKAKPLDIKYTRKELSTEDRILQIKAKLRTLPDTFSFERLIEDCHDIHEYIVTLLSILDLAKDHFLVFSVDENENIWFRRGSNHD